MNSTQNPYEAPVADVNSGIAAGAAELPMATRGARFAARMLDALVEMAPLGVAVVIGLAVASGRNDDLTLVLAALLGYLGVFGMLIFQIVRLVKTGQTLGKSWMKVKVVRMDGGPVTFGSHFVRGLVLGIVGIFSVVLIFRGDRRCLHDLAGETRVIAV